ncbi:MAG: DUF5320 domain-containing protein [Candidatus Riflebacteria bacterium]|nr:DUF5320 domain-containing protein [Candidatus Riflebacteria bacterium]
MPGLDKTGPNGLGEGTGRGAGECFNAQANNMRPRSRMMNGKGRGMGGRGFGRNIDNLHTNAVVNEAISEPQAKTPHTDIDQRLSKIENTLEKLAALLIKDPEKESGN